jgi:uncharacterized membrane protein
VMAIMTYPLALIFSALSLMPVLHFPPWALAVALPPFILGFLVWVVQKNAEPKAEGQADTPDECWRAGDIYVNPTDPAVFVEKRDGFGFTFNFCNPWGVRILALFLAGMGALVAFLIWSQR